MTREWKPDELAVLQEGLRPLVVIDPEDREQVERLMDLYAAVPYDSDGAGRPDVPEMQAALREFANPTPVKPDEPLGLGAVVEDADGEQWVMTEAGDDPTWLKVSSRGGHWETYSDIDVVRVLSEGVS